MSIEFDRQQALTLATLSVALAHVRKFVETPDIEDAERLRGISIIVNHCRLTVARLSVALPVAEHTPEIKGLQEQVQRDYGPSWRTEDA